MESSEGAQDGGGMGWVYRTDLGRDVEIRLHYSWRVFHVLGDIWDSSDNESPTREKPHTHTHIPTQGAVRATTVQPLTRCKLPLLIIGVIKNKHKGSRTLKWLLREVNIQWAKAFAPLPCFDIAADKRPTDCHHMCVSLCVCLCVWHSVLQLSPWPWAVSCISSAEWTAWSLPIGVLVAEECHCPAETDWGGGWDKNTAAWAHTH